MLYWLYLTVKLLKDTPEIKAPVYSGRLTESQLYMNTPMQKQKTPHGVHIRVVPLNTVVGVGRICNT